MTPKHPYHGPWPRIRRDILERDNHQCQIHAANCIGTATHVDHIIPWNEGGAWYDPANLRAACEPCNTGRSKARTSAMARLNRTPTPEPSRQW